MKDLIIYTSEDGGENLLSIKSVDELYGDKRYLYRIILKLWALTGGSMHIEASHPNYDVRGLSDRLRVFLPEKANFQVGRSFVSIFFSCAKHEVTDELLELLPEIWFAFEQPGFHFFVEEKIDFELKRQAWFNITRLSPSFVMFRGAQLDVVWIGKSDSLEFEIDSQ